MASDTPKVIRGLGVSAVNGELKELLVEQLHYHALMDNVYLVELSENLFQPPKGSTRDIGYPLVSWDLDLQELQAMTSISPDKDSVIYL